MSDLNQEYADSVKEIVTNSRSMLEVQKVMREKQEQDGERLTAVDESVKALTGRVDNAETALKANAERTLIVGDRSVNTADSDKMFYEYFAAVLRRDKEAVQKILTTGGAATGAEFVPTPFAATVVRLIEDAAIVRPRATVIPMTKDSLKFPSIASVTTEWMGAASGVGEGGAVTSSTPATSQVTLNADTLIGLVDMSNEEIADAEPNLAQVLATIFAAQMALDEDTQALAGTGATVNPFTGVLHETNVNETVIANGAIREVTSGELADIVASLTSRSLAGAVWVLHRTLLAHIRRLEDTAGNPVFAMPGGDQPGTIWGIPFVLSDAMPTAPGTGNQLNTEFLVLGNLSNIYIGDRAQFAIALSEEVLFKSNATSLRATERVAIKVAVPTAFARGKTGAA